MAFHSAAVESLDMGAEYIAERHPTSPLASPLILLVAIVSVIAGMCVLGATFVTLYNHLKNNVKPKELFMWKLHPGTQK